MNILARLPLDRGRTSPIASEKWIEEYNVPFVSGKEQMEILNFAGNTVEYCD